MSFINKLRERKVLSVASTMVSITETGKQSLDHDLEKGNAFKILAALDDSSPQSLSSISRECRIDVYAINNEVNRLRAQGKVTVTDFHGHNSNEE